MRRLRTICPDISYAYDNLGRMISAIDTDPHAVRYSYDSLGRVLSEGSDAYGTKTFQYDAAGRRTRMTFRDGFYVTYDYLVTGEMTAIKESGVNTLAYFTYDDLGRRTLLGRGNGTYTHYSYDPASRLAQLGLDFPGTTNDVTTSFAHNPAGQIVSSSRDNDFYAWTGHGNGTTGSSTNGLNQLATHGATAIAHDARGNLINDGARTFGYTAENLLATVNGGPGFAYDGIGRLYYTGATAVWNDYDGTDLVAEIPWSNNIISRRYIHGPGVDEPLVWYEGAGLNDRRFLHADERGSIIAVSDIYGDVVGINRYDEYGKPAATNIGRFQYTGQAYLPEAQLYYYKARMYDPKLPIFMQLDPIHPADGPNGYNYAGGDPVNRRDPSGLEEEEIAPDVTTEIGVRGPRVGGERSWDWMGMIGTWVGGRLDAARLDREQAWDAFEFATGVSRECVANARRCSAGDLANASLTIAGGGLSSAVVRGIGKTALTQFSRLCGCLEAGTLVATPEGLVPIETIEIGDLVLAVNEQTGEIAPKPVTDLIRPEPKPLYALTLVDAGGEAETFHATDDHPWKVEGKGWVETLHLKPGDRIDTGSGADMVVTSLTLTDRIEPTYNLTVADWHTFMVGEDGAVVHNSCPPSLSKFWKSLESWQGGIKRSGDRYYSYDRRHGEIEVFDKRGRHLGAVDPQTGQFIKGPVAGRSINVR